MHLIVDQSTLTRDRLLDAAELLVGRHGPHGVSLAEIGAEAGLSRGAVNYVFGSKDELLTALVGRAHGAWSSLDLAPCGRDLGRWLDGWAWPLVDEPEPMRLATRLLYESLGARVPFRELVVTAYEELGDRVAETLSELRSATDSPWSPTAGLVTGGVFGLVSERLADPSIPSRPAYAALRATLLVAGRSVSG